MTTHVIWDWNGTLLDDAAFSMGLMNGILKKRRMPTLNGIGDYHRAFAFPIRQYYANVGLTSDDDFLEAAHEWMDAYMAGERACALRATAVEAMDYLCAKTIGQVVISASEIGNLIKQVERIGIMDRFDALCGLNDIYGTGKADIARKWLIDSGAEAKNVVMIGDTAHDFDVARAIGCRCVLLDGGHQARAALETCGCPVADTPYEAAMIAAGEGGHENDAGAV